MARHVDRRLTILVIDHDGELHAHARAEFLGERVVRVGTPLAAKQALAHIHFDVVLCREADASRFADDTRVTVVDRPLTAEEILEVITAALARRARKVRRSTAAV